MYLPTLLGYRSDASHTPSDFVNNLDKNTIWAPRMASRRSGGKRMRMDEEEEEEDSNQVGTVPMFR